VTSGTTRTQLKGFMIYAHQTKNYFSLGLLQHNRSMR